MRKSCRGKVVKMLAAHRIRQKVALVLLLVFVEGCSSSAAIERRSGPTIVGRIDYSDANQLYVTGDDGGRYGIDRSDVANIDHPGKIGMVIGAITSGVGVGFLLLAPLAPNCSSREPAQPDGWCWNVSAISTAIGIGYLLAGLPILIGNLAVHSRSAMAVAAPRSPLQPLPARLSSP